MMTTRIIPALCALIAIAIFFGYINPTYTGQIATLSASIKSYDSALAAAQRFSSKETQLEGARNAFDPTALDRLDAYLPDSVDNIQLILDLNALADRSGLTLSNFDTSPSVDPSSGDSGNALGDTVLGAGSPLDSLDISLSAKGSYAALQTFMAGIEQSLRPLDLVDLSISDSGGGIYTYSMTYRIYWLR